MDRPARSTCSSRASSPASRTWTASTPYPDAVLEVDLDAIGRNWTALGRLHPSGPVGAVLKADGYGLGAAPVANHLYALGCRHFFVAHPEEALALHGLLPDALLACLNGLPEGAEADFAAHGITPVLSSPDEIERWAALARNGATPPAILHVDTGMARLGLSEAACAAAAERLSGVALAYVMTHLASTEDDAANRDQARRFALACAWFPAIPRSLASSGGIFLGPRYASDLARPGAALFGLGGRPALAPVIRLRAKVLQIRDLPAGAPVGYDATWHAARASRIAVVGLGYADGLPRALSNRGQAFFDRTPVPLVGRVSMDLTTFDVTDLPALVPGDWLDLVGPGGVDAVGAAAGTSGYEILTSLGRRFSRVWLA